MPAPLLIDLSHTGHTGARTGIQRVTRSLHAALGAQARAITFDPYQKTWREFAPWEHANLTTARPTPNRRAPWPLAAQLRGTAQRWLRRPYPSLPENCGVIVPEVFSAQTARALPALLNATQGPRAALFHDAIALKFPELTPKKTVARFPSYLLELLQFDGIAAVSADSRDTLIDYWAWLGLKNHPPVTAIPLGTHPRIASASPTPTLPNAGPQILSVGSIEGRKNHCALLDAAEKLWNQGTSFSLHLVGLAHPQTGAAALTKIRALQSAGRPLHYAGALSDAAVDAAYAACAFTVYPSLMEGFGLPVIESLAHGKPCICSRRGALAESAQGGGCLLLPALDAPALATAIASLVNQPATLATLTNTARARTFKTWENYSTELTTWLQSLPPRPLEKKIPPTTLLSLPFRLQ